MAKRKKRSKAGRPSESPVTLPAHREQAGAKARARREPDRIEPTPQMKRHKAIASGGEVGDPLSYLPIAQELREALDTFFAHARAAGWGVRCKTATLDDSPRGPAQDPEIEEARDLYNAGRYDAADAALLLAGKDAHRAVHTLRCMRREPQHLESLIAGAKALAGHYHIKMEDAA